jgi:hypothetical protein
MTQKMPWSGCDILAQPKNKVLAGAHEPWAFEIGRSHRDCYGRTP